LKVDYEFCIKFTSQNVTSVFGGTRKTPHNNVVRKCPWKR